MFAIRSLEEPSAIELVTRLFLCLVILLATYNRVLLARVRSSDRASKEMASNIEVTIDVPKPQTSSSSSQPSSDQRPAPRVHEEEFRYYGNQRHVDAEQQAAPKYELRDSEHQQGQQGRLSEDEQRHKQQERLSEDEQRYKQQESMREDEQRYKQQERLRENEQRYKQQERTREDEQRYKQQEREDEQRQKQQERMREDEQGSKQQQPGRHEERKPPYRVERVSEDERRWKQQQEFEYAPQPERYVADGDRYLIDQQRPVFKSQLEQQQQHHQPPIIEHRERQEHQKLPSPPHPREQLVYVPVAQQQQQPSSRQSSPRIHDGERRYSTSSGASEQPESRSRYSSVDQQSFEHRPPSHHLQQQHHQERVVLGSQQRLDEEQHPIRTKRASSLEASKLAHRVGGSLKVTPERIGVVIAGWPNELAIQCAKACVKRGFRMLPVGICLNESEDDRVDITDVGTIVLYRYGDSQLRTRLSEQLTLAAEKLELFPVIIDTSLQVDNIRLYQQFKVPFVFETRADSLEDHQRAVRETEQARCFALIAQRMDKHVAAVDSLFEDMARRFPGLFADPIKQGGGGNRNSSFEFTVKTSEPDEKVNRGLLNSMSDLLNKDIGMGKVQHLSSHDETEHHGLVAQPQTTKEPHVKRVYEIRNGAGSCVFHVEQDVNATYECAEGVADSVTFIAQKAQETARPRVYDILDVAHSSRFLTW